MSESSSIELIISSRFFERLPKERVEGLEMMMRLLKGSDMVREVEGEKQISILEDKLYFASSLTYGRFDLVITIFREPQMEFVKEVNRLTDLNNLSFHLIIFILKSTQLSYEVIVLLATHHQSRVSHLHLTLLESLLDFLDYYSTRFNYIYDQISAPSYLTTAKLSRATTTTLTTTETLTLQHPITFCELLLPFPSISSAD